MTLHDHLVTTSGRILVVDDHQDNVELLILTLFRTADETEESAVVRFLAPVLEAVEREASNGVFTTDASWSTSFRRLQQFGLLLKKTDLKAKELRVLLRIRAVQARLLEKLKLPASFQRKLDAAYVAAGG